MNNSIIQEAKSYGVTNMRAAVVHLTEMNLTSIPRFVFSMPNITRLLLTNNNLTKIPDDIDKLTTLIELSVGSNKLTTLPESIGNMSNLMFLDVYQNKLSTLPSSIGNLTKLYGLGLDDNKIKRLPESIGNLESLGNIDVRNNELTTLPESLGNLTYLEFLYLDGNKLTSLPESIGNLKNLRHIDMNTVTTLKKVPDSFKRLSPNTVVLFNGKKYKTRGFMNLFKPRITRANPIRINNSTNIFNGSIMEARLSNVPMNKRAFINNKSNVTNNGTLRRIYNVNGLQGYMRGKTSGRLHGGKFTPNKITLLKNVPFTVNKSAYLRNIKDRLANTSVNNMSGTIQNVKGALPTNVTKNDVNRLVKNVARNKVRNTAANSRNRVINALKAKGLLTNEDVKKFGN